VRDYLGIRTFQNTQKSAFAAALDGGRKEEEGARSDSSSGCCFNSENSPGVERVGGNKFCR